MTAGATRLPRDVVVLARLVDRICWNGSEGKVSGAGYSANRTAIDVLAERGILTNLDSDWAHTVRADWAREDWRHDDGMAGAPLDPAVVATIERMADQFIGRGDGYRLPDDPGVAICWHAAIDLLEEAGLAQWDD